ncbi:MAG: hypothetical protein R3E48_08560 [Burkholderiaceae bacterium]
MEPKISVWVPEHEALGSIKEQLLEISKNPETLKLMNDIAKKHGFTAMHVAPDGDVGEPDEPYIMAWGAHRNVYGKIVDNYSAESGKVKQMFGENAEFVDAPESLVNRDLKSHWKSEYLAEEVVLQRGRDR